MSDLQGMYLEDLQAGMTAVFSKTVTESDVLLYAGISGDTNPVHLDEEYAKPTRFGGRIAHGMLTAGFISAVLGTKLPGPGCIYMSQSLRFKAPVRIGETVTARVTVGEINMEKGRVTFQTICTVKDVVVVEGEALLMVPRRPVEAAATPEAEAA